MLSQAHTLYTPLTHYTPSLLTQYTLLTHYTPPATPAILLTHYTPSNTTHLHSPHSLVHLLCLPILGHVRSTDHPQHGNMATMNLFQCIRYLPHGTASTWCLDWQVKEITISTLSSLSEGGQGRANSWLVSGGAEGLKFMFLRLWGRWWSD